MSDIKNIFKNSLTVRGFFPINKLYYNTITKAFLCYQRQKLHKATGNMDWESKI
jgi:hypothetical protein